MVVPSIGKIVLIEFPFSDLSTTKLRPAVVLANAGHGDWVLCQITSNPYGDNRAVQITHADFSLGSLRITSYARPGKLFTANSSILNSDVGSLTPFTFDKIIQSVVDLLKPV